MKNQEAYKFYIYLNNLINKSELLTILIDFPKLKLMSINLNYFSQNCSLLFITIRLHTAL